jgi:hypothetical protein
MGFEPRLVEPDVNHLTSPSLPLPPFVNDSCGTIMLFTLWYSKASGGSVMFKHSYVKFSTRHLVRFLGMPSCASFLGMPSCVQASNENIGNQTRGGYCCKIMKSKSQVWHTIIAKLYHINQEKCSSVAKAYYYFYVCFTAFCKIHFQSRRDKPGHLPENCRATTVHGRPHV